jgi:hypothetical protein
MLSALGQGKAPACQNGKTGSFRLRNVKEYQLAALRPSGDHDIRSAGAQYLQTKASCFTQHIYQGASCNKVLVKGNMGMFTIWYSALQLVY